jgi:RND family efflux transporter MFP subunit
MNDDMNKQGRIAAGLRTVLVIVIVLIVAAFIGIKVKTFLEGRAKLNATPEKPLAVQVTPIHLRETADLMVVPGRVEAFARAKVSTETAGRIVEIPANKGDRVEAGQTLLKMDGRTAEDTMRQTEIQDRQAEKDIARLVELKKTGAVSDSDFEAAKKSRDLAAVAFEDAKVRFSQCEIRSPIAGVVNDRYVELGEYANSGVAIFEIVNNDRVKVAFNVPERDIASLSVDREVTFAVEVFPDHVFTGKVSFVAAAANKDSNSFAGELQAENPDHMLRAGMIARVSLASKVGRQAMVVPLAAVVPQKGDYVVYAVEDGRAARRLVKIDEIKGSEAVISEGISDGDNIVVEGARALVDGMPVRVVSTDGTGK